MNRNRLAHLGTKLAAWSTFPNSLNGLTRWLVTSPLSRVAAYVGSIEQGDFEATLTLDRSDEIGVLAQRLRNMTESIIGQLRKELGLFRGILSGIQNPFAVVNTELGVINYSDSMIRTTGRTGRVADFRGWPVARFFFDVPNRHVILTDVFKDGQPRKKVPFAYTNPKGESFDMLIDVVLVYDDEEKVLGGITFWNDVTEIKAPQRTIEAQKERIEEAAAEAERLSLTAEKQIGLLMEDVTNSSRRTSDGHPSRKTACWRP